MTLLSSTSQPAISPIFTSHTDLTLPSDSFITQIHDTEQHDDESKRTYVPRHRQRGDIVHPVVHIQSPTVRTTYIQAGGSSTEAERRREKGKARAEPLGVELPWIGMQLKRLGRREMSLEIGVLDSAGREGVLRYSSFQVCTLSNVHSSWQKSPVLHAHRSPPLIHLPLSLPSSGPSVLTSWLHISINLSAFLPLFHSLLPPNFQTNIKEVGTSKPRKRRKIAELPTGRFASVTFVRIYANCRVRRIWFVSAGTGDKDCC